MHGTIGISHIRRLELIIPIIAIAMLSVGSYATSLTVGSSTYQAQYGTRYAAMANFIGQDQGFTTQSVSVAASAQPCTWTTTGICRTAITAGHYVYNLKLTLNTLRASTTTYTVTVNWDRGSGSVQMCQLTVRVPSTASPAQYMNFLCDTSGVSITPGTAVDVTVA